MARPGEESCFCAAKRLGVTNSQLSCLLFRNPVRADLVVWVVVSILSNFSFLSFFLGFRLLKSVQKS